MDYRKKLILLIFIALLGLECLEAEGMSTAVFVKQAETCPQGEENGPVSERDFYPGIIRFHVIANSNSREDQNLKLKVRDYVMPRLETELTQKLTAENSGEQETIKEFISGNLEKINGWASECLTENGSDYEVNTELDVRAIPAKQYDDIYFPAGNYEALTIKIGRAEGENWWCVVFPPLCLIDSSGSAYNESFDIGIRDRIVLKSKVKELLAQRALLTKKERLTKKEQFTKRT